MKRSYYRRLYFFSIAVLLSTILMSPPVSYAQASNEEWNRATALFNDGQKRAGVSDFQGAIAQWEQALVIFKKYGEKQAISAVTNNLGIIYMQLGDYPKSITYYEQALAIAREIGDKKGEGADYGNLGNAYLQMGDYRKAINNYEQALSLASQVGDKSGKEIDTLGSIAMPMCVWNHEESHWLLRAGLGDGRGNRGQAQ